MNRIVPSGLILLISALPLLAQELPPVLDAGFGIKSFGFNTQLNGDTLGGFELGTDGFYIAGYGKLAKLEADGTEFWGIDTAPGPDLTGIEDLFLDAENNSYVAITELVSGGTAVSVVKFSSDSAELNRQALPIAPAANPYALSLTGSRTDGRIYVLAEYAYLENSVWKKKAVITCYNKELVFVSSTVFIDQNWSYGAISADEAGYVYYVGSAPENIDQLLVKKYTPELAAVAWEARPAQYSNIDTVLAAGAAGVAVASENENYILSLSAAGAQKWSVPMPYRYAFDEGLSMDGEGNVYTCSSTGAPDYYALLAKFKSADGTVVWALPEQNGWAIDNMLLDGQNRIYTVGSLMFDVGQNSRYLARYLPVGDKLLCEKPGDCDLRGKRGEVLIDTFAVRVIDTITGLPVVGATVTYSIISFIDKTGIVRSDHHEADVNPKVTRTTDLGYSSATLKLGTWSGTYIVRARCESCYGGQEQIARGTALNIVIEAEKTTEGDPEDTPIVQITQVPGPNGKSFTTAEGENHITLQALLLPETLDQNLIQWTIEDDHDDYVVSGTATVVDAAGPAAEFAITVNDANGVHTAPAGRPLPLGYKIIATAMVAGKEVKRETRVRQDEIDKCRQEYIDFMFNDGTTLDYTAVPRNKFILGIDENFSKTPRDCYAYIIPTRAVEAIILKNIPELSATITSGYRSPRKNINTKRSASNSWHMYGKAVDIAIKNSATDINYKKLTLWELAGLPKMLERDVPENSDLSPVTLKYRTGGDLFVVRKSFIDPQYKPNGTNKDSVPTVIKDGGTIIDVTTQTWNQWGNFKKFLLKGADEVPEVINNAKWIHLGE